MKKTVFILLAIVVALHIFGQDGSEIIIHDDLQLLPLTENVFIHRSYREYPSGRFASNGLIYISGDQAVLIDTPVSDSLTMKLIEWYSKQGVKITAAIPAHWHDDCLGGLPAIHACGIKSYGYRLTIDLAAKHDYPLPQIGFDDSLSLVLNGHDIEIKFMGAGHTADNLVAWIPDEKILFGGCMVKALSARGLGNTTYADINEWPHTIEKLINAYPDAMIVVPGHGAAGGPELLDYTLQLLKSR